MSPNRVLATAFLFASASASADIHVDESIPYCGKEEIDTHIVSEYLEMGSIMSKSLQETAAKSDVTVVRDGKKQGTYTNIAIISAVNTGNTFIGHAKGMVVSATLYVDDKQVSKETFTHSSSGSMFSAYKNSYAVLNRASKVLSSDITQWVVREQKNAQDK